MESQSYINQIPKDMIVTILMESDMDTVVNFCTTNTFYKHICENDYLWQHFYQQYYADSGMDEYPMSWFELVRTCFQLTRLLRWIQAYYPIINKTIKQFYQTTYLYLGSRSLMNMPTEIGSLHNLKLLIFDNNQLTHLPNSIASLSNLEYLNLSSNKFKEFPTVILNLHNLTSLNLNNNHITKIPKEIGLLHNLKELNLSNNLLVNLPNEIGLLSHLETLSLRNNLIARLQDISQLFDHPVNVNI